MVLCCSSSIAAYLKSRVWIWGMLYSCARVTAWSHWLSKTQQSTALFTSPPCHQQMPKLPMNVISVKRNLCTPSVVYSTCSLHIDCVNVAVDECDVGEEAPLGACCCWLSSSLHTDCFKSFGDKEDLRASVNDSACNLCTNCMLWEVAGPLEQSLGSTGTAVSVSGLNSDIPVVAHIHILLKYLSGHEPLSNLHTACIQPVSSRILTC